MIKENQKYLNRLHVVIDGIVVYCSFCLTYYIRFDNRFTTYLLSFFLPQVPYYRKLWQYQPMLIVLVPVYLILYARFGLYKPKRYQNGTAEAKNIIQANTCAILFFFIYIFFMKIEHVPRSLILMFYVISMITTLIERFAIRKVLQSARRRGNNLKHVIIIGFSTAAEAYIDRIKANPQWGYMIHGIFDDNLNKNFQYKNISCIGKIKDLEKYLEKTNLDEVAITLSLKEYNKLESIVNTCEKSGVHTKFIPDYYKFIPTNPVTEDLNGLPVINIRNVPLTNTVNRIIKRFIDIIGSLVCIVLFSPVMIVVAILVKRSSPGPIIFCQERVGLHNKPFKMYKFRSMGVQPASKEKTAWTTHNDPRVTPVGRVIRKTSIDELPQLFNVLRGDMSLIGPRPERPLFVEKFKEEIPRYMIKHQVRPGMTGWAQANGLRGDTSIEKRIEYDIFYIENWTLTFDIKILFLTVFKGFINKNAY
ncbi:MAG: undecaprenyl-phosphate glucose phosphotransferase [Clostridiales bacterium]|nr:undecaprenyl-phosphate glucose phosphotransferase [Clostridiales bacterium]